MNRIFLSHLYQRPTLLLAALLSSSAAALICPTPGKDGVGSSLTGVVNTYYPGAASAAAGATSLSLGTSTGSSTQITPGDLLVVVQMQDATLNATNTSAYGAGGTNGTGATAVGAGKYEYVVATSSASGGGSVNIKGDGSGGGLINSYTDSAYTTTSGAKRFQIIRVPQYSSATLGAALSAPAWNGTSGGVVAIDVAGSLGLNSGTITVSGLGFRGGGGRGLSGGTGGTNTDYRNLATNAFHAQKGEGIAGTPRYLNNTGALLDTTVEGYPNGSSAQGAPGNAGGGGTDGNPTANDQNSGGGGGSGAGAGGKGGRTWSSQSDIGGRGGSGVTPTATALVMGGGGGAGTTNNATGTPASGFASSGAAGGGLVLVRAGSISGTGSITANGADANNTVLNDGSGGGGGGGTVLVTSSAALPATLSIYANGGAGGTNTGGGAPHGPGGGGGGGAIVLSGSGPATVQRNGGAAGTTAAGGTDGTTFGAIAGSAGTLVTTATPTTIPGAAGSSSCFAALTVTKTTSTPSRVQSVDTAATYTVTVSNTGGGVIGAAITDALPSPLAYTGTAITPTYSGGASGPASVTGSGTTAVTFGTPGGASAASFYIPTGGSVSLTFAAALNSATPGTYQNPATVTYSDPTRTGTQTVSPGGVRVDGGTVGGSNYASGSSTAEDVTVTPAADLAITKTDGVASVNAGGTTTYTVRVTNNGPSSVTGATLTDAAATGLSKTAVACSGTPGQCSTPPTVAQLQTGYSLPSIASGQFYELTVTTSVTAVSGSVANTATIAVPSGTTDPTPGNNSATDTDTVTPATLSLQKALASGGRVANTDQFTLSIGGTSVTTTGTGSSVTSAAFTLNPATVGTAYTLSETASGTTTLANYTSTYACTNTLSGGQTPSGAGTSFTVTPVPGDALSCTFTNTRKSATLNLKKTWAANSLSGDAITVTTTGAINNASVVATATAAGNSVSGGSVTVYAGEAITLPGETFTTGNAANYTTALACTGTSGLTGSTLTVGAADTAIVCTYTNTRKSVTLTLKNTWSALSMIGDRVTLSSSGLTNNASTPVSTVASAATQTDTGTAVTVYAGDTGTLVETFNVGSAASYATGLACTGTSGLSGSTLTVGAADTAIVCTFTNTLKPDLTVTKTHSGTWSQGDTGKTYTLTASNSGGSTTSGTVTVTDTLPTGLTATAISGTGWTCTLGTLTCTRSDALTAGSSYPVITVTVTVSSTAAATVTNTAAVSGGGQTNTTNDTASDPTSITPAADLAVTKTDGVASVNAGGTTTYTIRVTNNGASSVTGAILTDAVATGLTKTAVACSGTPSQCSTPPTVAQLQAGYALPALANGQFYELTVTASVSATSGSVANVATIAVPSGTTDPTAGNNAATDTDTVTPVADLTLTKTDGVSSVTPGSSTTYTLTLTNNGPSSANNTVLTDPAATGLLKTGISCVAAGGAACPLVTTLTLETGLTMATLPAGGSITLTVPASVTAVSGSVTNSVTATLPGGTVDPTPTGTVSDTDIINPVADLAVTKTDGVASVTAGSTTTYTVRVTNNGPSSVTGAILTDAAATGLSKTAVACSGTPGQCSAGTTPTITQLQAGYALPAIASGQFYELTVTASVTAVSGSVANTATIAVPSGTTDATPGNNSATDTDTVTPVADLTITKTHSGTWSQGDTGKTYTLTVANSGLGSTSGTVSVTDTLPTGLSTTAISGTGWTCTLGTLTCTRSDVLTAGNSYPVITVTVSVSSTAAATVTNTAAVSGGGQTNTTNDAASDPTTITPAADLSITKTDGVTTFHVGSVLTYTVVVSNAGPSTATGATVNDPLPSGIAAANMSYTATASGGATTTVTGTKSGALSDTVTLAPGATVTYTVTITVPTGYASGSLVNTATVTAPGSVTDSNTANNTATDTDTREPPVANNDTAATNPLVPVTFNITNNDTGPVNPATVDLDPATSGTQTTFTDPGKGTYTVDASGNVTFTPAAGFVTGTSSIPYTVKDFLGVTSNAATITVTVPAGADLATAKSGPAFAAPGDTLTYTITVTNTTAAPAAAYTVTDTLASGLTFVSASNGGIYNSGSRTVTWTLASIGASAQQALTITATAPSAAQVTGGMPTVQNTATATLPGDPTAANNTSAPVTTRMILNELSKNVRNVTTGSVFGTTGSGKPGEVLEYCLAAHNLGGADLGTATSGYLVKDTLPGNVSALLTAYDADEPSAATGYGVRVTRGAAAPTYLKSDVATLTGTNLNVNLGTVTAGETVTVCFQATIR
ncbi:DUF11 domain-containing protein [Deinococcus sp. KSM4-11]|uniref:isopeptide-forming domain-containing fimbrial protein n=1 Tax=Deinococcus sp. KSM4-11 TaxID=2568654 RepID=UPI0010A344EB|nr:isopeptide-forming domain-containing fimbrial protein [Deinococcus sp. KSM4-11]THF85030.1 DUF11 domain-containing protein [Deinococcus sp. KSM4-11]